MSIDPALAARVAPLHGMTVLEAMTADLPGPRVVRPASFPAGDPA